MKQGEHVTPTIRLIKQLGSGAMGDVWVAEHLTLGTQVAVKLMTPRYAREPEFIARFRAEAQAAARIRSPHVVQVFDHGVTEAGTPYIVMELLEGETLGQRLGRLGPLPLGDVVRIVVHTANALGRAHQLGIVHRDVKPDNLFLIEVGSELFVKVLDFGIAKQPAVDWQIMTETGRMMGTAFYMSPEQLISAKHVDHRTDVWALAVVAYEALTGRRPFEGVSIGEQAVVVHRGGFKKPSELRPELPAAIDAWAARALQRDPEQRFGSTRELADALEDAVRAAMMAVTAPVMARPEPAVAPVVTEDRTTAPRMAPVTQERGGTLISAMSSWEGRLSESSLPELRVGAGRIRVVQGDIVEAGTEAIVTSTGRDTAGLLGLDAAIHKAAGPELWEMLRASGPRQVGGAVITGAGQIPPPTRFIIHAVGPRYEEDRDELCAALLLGAHAESLRLAEENGVKSVAFPAISAGFQRYPVDKAAPIAIEAACAHLARFARSVGLIVFVLRSGEHFTAFVAALSLARGDARG